MQNDTNKFSFTYSAPTEEERREIEGIRRQYKPSDEDESKMDRLRKLHAKVVGPANAASLASGVVGLLIFGAGMALALELEMLAVGIIISVIGVPPIVFAYPLYKYIMLRGKKKYGEEILRLSEEILGEE